MIMVFEYFQARDLEVAVDDEKRRYAETEKNLRKQERRMKELQFQSDEDHKNQGRMQDMIDKLQNKIKTYKHQVEEAVSNEIIFFQCPTKTNCINPGLKRLMRL